jgi:adenylate kinase family enzyme
MLPEPNRGEKKKSVSLEPRDLRILIIGNCGSGKTWLALKLSEALRIPICHMDQLIEPDDPSLKRDRKEVYADIMNVARGSPWIIEGAFGDCAATVVPWASHIVWIDLPWDECRANIMSRGARNDFWGTPQTPERTQELLVWAAGYDERTTLNSRQGHAALLALCAGEQMRIRTRAEMDAWTSRLLERARMTNPDRAH